MKTKSKKAKTGLGHHKWLCFRRDHDLQKAQKRYSTRIGGEPQRIEIDGRYLYLGPIPEPEQPEQTEDILPYGEGLQPEPEQPEQTEDILPYGEGLQQLHLI